MRPGPGEVLHFSEDPTIREFVPRRGATQQIDTVHVWAVDEFHAPSYWFPRQCPRAMAWPTPMSDTGDVERLLGPGGERVHAIEDRWLATLRTTRMYAYRFDAIQFRPVSEDGHAQVCDEPIRPLGPPEEIGDLLAAHSAAGIELRVLHNLWPFWRRVVDSTLGYSGIRLANARTHPIQATFTLRHGRAAPA
jgi:hypothetical protein